MVCEPVAGTSGPLKQRRYFPSKCQEQLNQRHIIEDQKTQKQCLFLL
jgi:hypothetical protein